jgi:hypothetical protein
MNRILLATIAAALLASAPAHAGDQRQAARNQGYQSAAVDDICNHGGQPWLKVDEAIQNALDQAFTDNPKLQRFWEQGKAAAMAEYSAAYDREDGRAIDAICFKAAKLPQPKRWLDGSDFHGFYTQRCSETPFYYMCKR